jgi:beta-aspartyl-peptidase (threonine type)
VIIVASANGNVGIGTGVAVLRHGGSALDAVEAACRVVEDNLSDHSVGTGGYPNLAGEVELDASIMDGRERRSGAVAALKGFANPITVARLVMTKLPQHVLLVGGGAERFALEHGFKKTDLLTPESQEAFGKKKAELRGEQYSFESASTLAVKMTDPSKTSGTVNFLAIDSQGNFASAVSTSGWAFKYPGRVGDSPIVGAGNYCDNRSGACACTGLGEWAIRASTAHTVVMGMRLGLSLDDACRAAIEDLKSIPLEPGINPVMNLIALDSHGTHAAYSTHPGTRYIWQTPDMSNFGEAERNVAVES